MLLRQVSVMNIANSRKPYINVTSNNLVTVYTPQEGKPFYILVLEMTREEL